MRHLTVRWRLTLLFAMAYFGVAGLLIATAYFTVRARLDDSAAAEASSFLGGNLPLPAELIDANAIRDVRTAVVDDTLSALLTWSIAAAAVSGAIAIGLGWYTSGRALSPVRQVTRTAQRLSGTNLSERVRYDGPTDELSELAHTFDTMLDRIESGFDSQRQFTAMASHELRTPLAHITAAASLARSTPDAMSQDE